MVYDIVGGDCCECIAYGILCEDCELEIGLIYAEGCTEEMVGTVLKPLIKTISVSEQDIKNSLNKLDEIMNAVKEIKDQLTTYINKNGE